MKSEIRKLFLMKKTRIEIYNELSSNYDKKQLAAWIGHLPDTKKYFKNKLLFTLNSLIFTSFILVFLFLHSSTASLVTVISNVICGMPWTFFIGLFLYRGNILGFGFTIVILLGICLEGFSDYYQLSEIRFLIFGLVSITLIISNVILLIAHHDIKDFLKNNWDKKTESPLL